MDGRREMENYRRLNKHLVLIGDPESGEWSIAVSADHEHKEVAREKYLELKADKTPTIFITTSDYVVF